MCPTGIIVLFACKSCSASFESVSDFIKHKRLNHFMEFQKTEVILFEEKKPGKPCDLTLLEHSRIQRMSSKFPALKTNSNHSFESKLQTQIKDFNPNQLLDKENISFQEDLERGLPSKSDFDLELNASQSNEFYSSPENNPHTAPVSLSDDSSADDEQDVEVMETDYLPEKIDQGHERNATMHVPGNNTNDFPVRYNPFVLVKRLNPAEIQGASSTNVNNCYATDTTKTNSDLFHDNSNPQTKANIEAQKNSSNSGNFDFAVGDHRSSTFGGTLSECDSNFDPDTDDFFIEPQIEITVLDDEIDVDLNVNGAAWGEITASTSTAGTGPRIDAAYEEFLLRYSPFVPLKRLTSQEIKDAAAGKLNLLNNSLPLIARQLQACRNQEEEDDDEYLGELGASILNSTGTGSRFLDDLYEVNFNEAGHIVFKPNIDHQNVDPSLGETSTVCSLCKFVTGSKVSLKNHMNIHSKALVCSHMDCFASFDTRPSLQQHYSVWHSPLKPYRCSYADCYKAYESSDNLKVHIMDHSGERPFRCTHENCSAEFKTKFSLAYHTSAHAEERSFKCPKKGCLQSFFNKHALRTHLRRHPLKRFSFSCSIPNCKRRFRSLAGAQAHMRKDFHPENTALTSPEIP